MATQDSLSPLSKEEETKLATLAIEAKGKAYCESFLITDSVFCGFSCAYSYNTVNGRDYGPEKSQNTLWQEAFMRCRPNII